MRVVLELLEKALVSRVNRRMCIRMVRFARSTKLVQMCSGLGLPLRTTFVAPMHPRGCSARSAIVGRPAVNLLQHGVVDSMPKTCVNGVDIQSRPSVVICTRFVSRDATSSMNSCACSAPRPPTRNEMISLRVRVDRGPRPHVARVLLRPLLVGVAFFSFAPTNAQISSALDALDFTLRTISSWNAAQSVPSVHQEL